ncbi:MAG: mersacidin/lichenicidin family type 2 lantibiotic [Caldilineaceae bacterium]
MSNINIIRAWKDEAYRNSLSNVELAALPEKSCRVDRTHRYRNPVKWSVACCSLARQRPNQWWWRCLRLHLSLISADRM